MKKRISFFKSVRYLLEALIVYPLYGICWLMPIRWSAALGGTLARMIGPHMKVHRTAQDNLSLALPRLSEEEHTAILRGMWDNLGRTAGELAHLSRLTGKRFRKRVEVIGAEHLEKARDAGRGMLFFSGHFANWELAPKSAAELGAPITTVYRPANNPLVEWLIQRARNGGHRQMLPKGRGAARSIAAVLNRGGAVGMLVDQKMNDGIPVPFFGRNAMTAPALARYAEKYDVPLIPAQVERLPGSYFRVTIYPPMEHHLSSHEETMRQVNIMLERWVRANPEQWFWVHRRWPKEEKRRRKKT